MSIIGLLTGPLGKFAAIIAIIGAIWVHGWSSGVDSVQGAHMRAVIAARDKEIVDNKEIATKDRTLLDAERLRATKSQDTINQLNEVLSNADDSIFKLNGGAYSLLRTIINDHKANNRKNAR